ncbi:hypothetical protein [Chitinimonas koreensis]|uniref:hypothetical protein n=1 Tax=Chitinimonas koreensis TaxID=356302 RepID=UPI00223EC60D|nr:hypothetical protein [Chitinimonas koreensis]
MAGEKDHLVAVDLAESQRARRLAVGRADDLTVGDLQVLEPGESGSADDGEHAPYPFVMNVVAAIVGAKPLEPASALALS